MDEKIEALYEKAETEDAVPWNDALGVDNPQDLAAFLKQHVDDRGFGVADVSWEQPGLSFLVTYTTGAHLRVSVSVAEPSPRFYPVEGEPDDREKKDFEEAFEDD